MSHSEMHTHNMVTSALTLKYTVFELKKPCLCEPCFLSEKTGLRLKQAPLQPCLSSAPPQLLLDTPQWYCSLLLLHTWVLEKCERGLLGELETPLRLSLRSPVPGLRAPAGLCLWLSLLSDGTTEKPGHLPSLRPVFLNPLAHVQQVSSALLSHTQLWKYSSKPDGRGSNTRDDVPDFLNEVEGYAGSQDCNEYPFDPLGTFLLWRGMKNIHPFF